MSVETTSKFPLITDDDFQNLPVTLTALINDTTGTLIASHYVNPLTKIACIFGTGCNAAYMERASAIEKIESLGIDPNAEMVINCEWVNCRVLASNSRPHPWLCFRVLLIPLNTNIYHGQDTMRLSTRRPINPENRLSKCVRKSWTSAFAYLLHLWQKLISGRYLGEILRLVICELIDEGVLFLGQNTYKIERPYAFDTAFLSLMER